MSYSNRFIILLTLLFSPCAYAYEVFIDALYWRATESFDWMFINDRNVPHQNITYKTAAFDYEPGFRIGIISPGEWDTRLYYTRYHTDTSDSAVGKITPALLASKMAQPSIGYYYDAGQLDFTLHYNVIDADLSKCFYIHDNVMLRPVIGLQGAWIDQNIDTALQGQVSIIENVSNDFRGFGPKAGIEGVYTAFKKQNLALNLFANFSAAYLWGNWSIHDRLVDSNQKTIIIQNKNRNMASVNIQSAIGLNIHYCNFYLKLGYEMTDWLNQFQVFDDGTGGHSNDLVLQGFTLGIGYKIT